MLAALPRHMCTRIDLRPRPSACAANLPSSPLKPPPSPALPPAPLRRAHAHTPPLPHLRKQLWAAATTLADGPACRAINHYHNTEAKNQSGVWAHAHEAQSQLGRLEALLAELQHAYRRRAAAAVPAAAAYARTRAAAAEARAAAEAALARAAAAVALALTARVGVAAALGRAVAVRHLQTVDSLMVEADGAAAAAAARQLASHPLEDLELDDAEAPTTARSMDAAMTIPVGRRINIDDIDGPEEGPSAPAAAPRGGPPPLHGGAAAALSWPPPAAEAGACGFDGRGGGGMPPLPPALLVSAAAPEPRGRRFGWAGRLARGVVALGSAAVGRARGGEC
jgi:hypothetical protein